MGIFPRNRKNIYAFMGLLLGIGSAFTGSATIESFPWLGNPILQTIFKFIATIGSFAFNYLPVMFAMAIPLGLARQRHLPDFRFQLPEATYLAWIDCSNLPFTSDQLQDALVHHAKVAIMPSEKYGSNTHIRMNIGCPRIKVIEGLNRLKKAVDYLRDRHSS